MASKRMFSKGITSSDAFLDMPASTQALYFHFGMEADDDGFIGNPKKVMRSMGVGEDDFKILVSKRFVLLFPSGVLVVKHHRINNNWDKYNCKRTMYLEEFSQLHLKENKAYTLDETQGIPVQSDSSLKTVFRIEENRIDKNTNTARPSREKSEEKNSALIVKVIDAFKEVNPSFGKWYANKTQRGAADRLVGTHGLEGVLDVVRLLKKTNGMPYFPTITTPVQLEDKWAQLESAMRKKKGEINTRKQVII